MFNILTAPELASLQDGVDAEGSLGVLYQRRDTGAVTTWNPTAGAMVSPGAIGAASAESFGISPEASPAARSWDALAAYILNAYKNFDPFDYAPVIELPAGDFLIPSGAKLNLTARSTGKAWSPRFTLRGAGQDVTVLRAAPDNDSPAVLEILCGFAAHVTIEGLSIYTRTDIEQDMLHFVATRRTLDDTGGVTLLKMTRIGGRSNLGDGVVFVGGNDFLAPNQFITLEQCSWNADTGTALKSLGQMGQFQAIGGEFSGELATSACPSVVFMQDLRQTVNATSVNTTDETITSPLEVPTGTPVRIIGTNLPGGLSTGTTYFVRRFNIAATTTGDAFTLHTSRANVRTNTKVNITSTGTLANWFLCPLYLTSVGPSALNFDRPHHLTDGSPVTVVGTSLPTGLATSTTYYVIRYSALQIGLATSKANALAGTAITFSGGDVTRFGLSSVGNGGNPPYSIDLIGTSIQNTISALYLAGAQSVRARLHIENCKNTLYAYQSVVTIDSGNYANAANDGGAGVVYCAVGFNARLSIEGMPLITGTTDKLINAASAAVYSNSQGGIARLESTAAAGSTGMLLQLSAASTLDTGAHDFVFVNASATVINTISSRLGPKATLTIVAWSGSITLGGSGNIVTPGGANVTLTDRGVAVLRLVDTIGTWVLVSKTV